MNYYINNQYHNNNKRISFEPKTFMEGQTTKIDQENLIGFSPLVVAVLNKVSEVNQKKVLSKSWRKSLNGLRPDKQVLHVE